MIPLQGAIVPIVQMVGAVGGKKQLFRIDADLCGPEYFHFILYPGGDISAVSAGKSTRPPPLTAATCFKPFFELSSDFHARRGHGGDRGLLKRL